jgi:two-component system, NtrC family, sensor kinase
MRRGAKPTKAKVEAKPPIVRKSSKSKGSRVQDLEELLAEAVERESEARKRESEALEQQTATSEILRVISSSPTDLQPVLNAVVKSAARFCGAADAELFRLDGEHLKVAAHSGPIAAPVGRLIPVVKGSVSGRAFAERRAIHVADLQAEAEEFPVTSGMARELGFRTSLSVPLLREGMAVGTITLRRAEVNPFTDKQIALLQTFADQAVIAIENVRLFHEMKEALEQQTATSEILRIISSSPTDLQPVFNTIVRSADRLCNGLNSAVYLYDGELVHHVALSDPSPEARVEFARQFPQRPNPELGVGRVVLTGTIAHSADVLGDPNFGEGARRFARLRGFRALLLVPMLRAGRVVGVISVGRAEPGLFPDSQVTLLQTFADQAVIAIENGRLFTELQEKNRALTQAHAQVTETLEQQTATSEILRTIAHSQTDVQPVFETIVRNSAQLCQATSSLLWLLEGDRLRIVAPDNLPRNSPTELAVANAPNLSRTIRDGAIHNIGDTENDPRITGEAFRLARLMGARAVLTVPMRRDREGIGALTVYRRSPGVFTDGQVELLKTFADQAVIAIENVRLFKELEARNRDLTATSEILQVISRSPTDVQPVFDTIAERAMRLCEGTCGLVNIFDGELIHVRAVANIGEEGIDALQQAFPTSPSRGSGVGRVILTGDVVQIPDVLADPEYELMGPAQVARFRNLLGVPMLHRGRTIGVLTVGREEPGTFAEEQIHLLRTFADQAVIAIENVRLFTELQASNRDLTSALDTQTATSDILRVISRSQTDVQPVFDAIVDSAVRLLRGNASTLSRIEGDLIALAAMTRTDDPGDASQRARFPMSIHSEGDHAQAVRNRVPLHSTDAHSDPRLPETQHASARLRGYRSLAVVPLVRHDEAVGALGVSRREPGGFTDDEIALLKTFADQAVIAIENVRLFTELEGRNRDLTATSEILRVISSSPTDVQPVFDTIVRSAVRLCDGLFSALYQFDGELIYLVAQHNFTPKALEEAHRVFPASPNRALLTGRAILERTLVHIPDVEIDPEHQYQAMARAKALPSASSR